MRLKLLNRTCQVLSVIGALALTVGLLSLTGCNTWEGAGKDVERAGEAMQGD